MWMLLWIALVMAVSPAPVRAQSVTLVSQLDPAAGDDPYGDVWGEGDYAYVGSFIGSGVAIIDISDPTLPFLETT